MSGTLELGMSASLRGSMGSAGASTDGADEVETSMLTYASFDESSGSGAGNGLETEAVAVLLSHADVVVEVAVLLNRSPLASV